jgi:hypothetical protein
MVIDPFLRQLVETDNFAQYSLRSTFFVRKLRELDLWRVIQEVRKLVQVSASFEWDNLPTLGIDLAAWERIENLRITPVLFFCHPRVLAEQPRLLLYYRTIALISQKGLGSLVGGGVAGIEEGRVEQVAEQRIRQLVQALNSILSVIAKSTPDLQAEQFAGYQFAAAGATIQGSWNNAIGEEGIAQVRTILIEHLRDEIVQIVWRDSTSTSYRAQDHAALLARVADMRSIRLKDGYHLLFGSEPDISLRDSKNVPIVAMEVKAGNDKAGALERLGAAMKSFENDKNINARVKTVYIVRAMTPELQTRISQGNPFDHTFVLGELLANARTQKTFANLVLRAILGK